MTIRWPCLNYPTFGAAPFTVVVRSPAINSNKEKKVPDDTKKTGLNISLYFLPEWKGKVLKILSFREGFLRTQRLKKTLQMPLSVLFSKDERNNTDFFLIFNSHYLNYENVSC